MKARWFPAFVLLLSSGGSAAGRVPAAAAQVSPAALVARPATIPAVFSQSNPFSLASDPWSVTTPVTNCVQPPDGLVSWWSGDNSAQDIWDGNNGTLEQGAVFGQGMSGRAFRFDGVNDYIQVGPRPSLVMTRYLTMDAWIFPTGPGSDPLYGGTVVNKEGEYEIDRFADGTIQWAFANTDPGWRFINTGYVASIGQWTHLAVVYDAGLITTYANGVEVHSYSGSGDIGDFTPTENDFRIGGRQSTRTRQFFQGRIDEVDMSNRADSAEEIQAIYDAGSVGKCKPVMFVEALNPSYRRVGEQFRVGTYVSVRDLNGHPVAGVRVFISMAEPDGNLISNIVETDINGNAGWFLFVQQTGTYTFCVQTVRDPGRRYDPSHNVETCDRVTIP